MTAKIRYLVTGRTGQVAQSLMERVRQQKNGSIELIPASRPSFDLSRPETVRVVIEDLCPDIIISAAAYTAVDQAESDEETARLVNGAGPHELAKAARARSIPVVHLSTDYVFDGTKTEPYVETDAVAPLGAYGRSKLEGEQNLLNAWDNVAILRTAWVYSPFGKNFVKTMLRVAETRDELSVVDDQIGNPTSALDIADAILAVSRNLLCDQSRELRGIFHMTGHNAASWADFAEEIFENSRQAGGPYATVKRIRTVDYPTPAKRPSNSRLNNDKLLSIHGIRMPDWKISTREVVTQLVQSKNYL